MPKKSKGIMMYLAMFGLLIVLLVAMMSLDKPVSTLKYYQVLDYFKQGKVEEYQIDYNDGELSMMVEGQKQPIDYQLASISQFNEDIKPYVEKYEQTSGNTFKRNYLPPKETPLIVALLPTLLLFINGAVAGFLIDPSSEKEIDAFLKKMLGLNVGGLYGKYV